MAKEKDNGAESESTVEIVSGSELGLGWEELIEGLGSSNTNGQAPIFASWSDAKSNVLENIPPVDFAWEAELSENEIVTLKVLTVVVIRVLQRLMLALGVGLCNSGGQLLCYLGSYWKQIDRIEMKPFFGGAANSMGVRQIISEHHSFRESLVKQFDAVASFSSPESKTDKILINLLNGTFEITEEGRHLREFQPSDFMTYQLPFAYDPSAGCPQWRAFLNTVLPDLSSQKVLAEGFARAFSNIKLEKVLMLYGAGANGKSVIFDVIQAVFGPENVTNYSLGNLGHPYFRAKIANRLLNFSSELSSGIDPDIFKKLASGEPIDARNVYEQPFIVRQYAKLVFNCNELPKDVEHTLAFFRRFLIVPFRVVIPENEQNPNLAKEIISTELAGVFNWILEGLDWLISNREFSHCAAADQELKLYKLESDSVALFLDEYRYGPYAGSDRSIKLKDLHHEYKFFCSDNGYRPVSSRTLRKRLTFLGYESTRTNKGVIVYAFRSNEDIEENPLF